MYAYRRKDGSIGDSRLQRDDQECVRGWQSRGGRSRGEEICRGDATEGSASIPAAPCPSRQVARLVQQKGSVILTEIEVEGACGKPRPFEQPGPEQGKSRRGTAGAGLA